MTGRAGGVTTPLPFVGRVDELGELAGRLAALRSGSGGVVLVAGEPGIGKTRLIEQAITGHRGPVAWGTAMAGDGVPPFWPWRRVLRQVLADDAVATTARSRSDVRPLTEDRPDTPLPGGASRYRLSEGVLAALAEAGRRDGLVVVLDDLHRADEGSIRLLQVVAQESRHLPVLLLVAYRDTELDVGHPLVGALPDLARSGPLLSLDGLTAADLRGLYRSSRDGAAPAVGTDAGEVLRHRTGGNPFFVGEVLRVLPPSGTGGAGVVLSASAPLRGGVRSVVDRWLARLPEVTRDLLAWAAVDGTTLDVELLASVTGLRRRDALAALDPAVAARLLEVRDDGAPAFVHGLVREALVASLPLDDRVERHWALGTARSRTVGADTRRIASVAGHLVAGVAAGDADEAVRWAVRAAEEARRVLAYEDAAAWYRRALAARRGSVAGDRTDGDLLLALGDAELDAGRLPAAGDAFLAAARLVRERGDGEALAAAAPGPASGGSGSGVALVDHVRIDLLREALAALAPVAHHLATTARVTGRPDAADRFARLAEELCSVAGIVLFPPPVPHGPGVAALAAPPPGLGPETGELRREGDLWAIGYAGTTVRVRDSKGLRDLVVLLRSPGRAVHVTELTGAPVGSTDADLDRTAVAAYRRRLADLEEEVERAEAAGDVGRRSALVTEREFLVAELAGALGLGGRRRRSGDPVERARKAVTGRIRDGIERVALVDPVLGRHLTNSIRTGTWCCYRPERPVTWRLR